jgi:hypothetical protein
MYFNEKLDTLMRVQGVSNSRLAKALSVDPSLVSRWRTGDRKPANKNYIERISDYLVTQAKMDYQKSALFEIMGLGFNKNEIRKYSISDLLYSWLSNESSPDTQLIEGFFSKLENHKKTDTPLPEINTSFPSDTQPSGEVLYGTEGKREGVIRFLCTVAAQTKPCTMLLYSDENMDWLTEDKSFYIKWGALLMDVIRKGHKIKIIHTINRELSEMLSAIERWLPLYLTGAIEPYYYPKYREHIFRRTMFIAPDVIALSSNALSEHSNEAEQFLYTDKKILKGLTDEFNIYLAMCRPLMRIFTGSSITGFNNLQMEFEEQSGSCISFSDMLSFLTMPESLLIKLLNKCSADKSQKESILSMHRSRFKAFVSNIEHNNYTEIVILPPISEISDNKISIKPNDLLSNITLSYTPQDYCEHIENIIDMINKYNNFNFLINNKKPAKNIFLTAKAEVGAIVVKNDIPPIVFAFNQQNMTNSFSIYLDDIIREIPEKDRNKKHVIKALQEYKQLTLN